VYYLGDVSLHAKSPFGSTSGIPDLLQQAMNPECSANVMSFICNAWFPTCEQVTNGDGDDVRVPTLTCKIECETFTTTWTECLKDVETNDEARDRFDSFQKNVASNVASKPAMCHFDFSPLITPIECDASGGLLDAIVEDDMLSVLLFGRHPAVDFGTLSFLYPPGQSTDEMHPPEYSLYTFPDGTARDVHCRTRFGTEAQAAECPVSFVSPAFPDSSPNPCVFPCPISAFSDPEYRVVMWLSAVVPGMVGLTTNSFMLLTWQIAPSIARETQLSLKGCVVAGMMCAIVETLPVLLLNHELPCGCDAVECIGEGATCAINRSSPCLLMVILLNLMCLLGQLLIQLKKWKLPVADVSKLAASIAWGFPAAPMAIGHAVENNDFDTPNQLLNSAR
jgi:hypothetical protein